jgi:hypothetical protein
MTLQTHCAECGASFDDVPAVTPGIEGNLVCDDCRVEHQLHNDRRGINVGPTAAQKPVDATDTPWLSKPQAAAYMGVSIRTFERKMKSIRYSKRNGRAYFTRAALDDYLRAGTVAPVDVEGIVDDVLRKMRGKHGR